MNKFKIVCNHSNQKDVLELLTQSGCFEVCEAEKAILGQKLDITHQSNIKAHQAQVTLAIEYLETLSDKAQELNKNFSKQAKKGETSPDLFDAPKVKNSSVRVNLGYDDYKQTRQSETELLAVCNALEAIQSNYLKTLSRIEELQDQNNQLILFRGVSLPFSRFKDTHSAAVLLASGPSGANKTALERLDCFVEEFPSPDGTLWGVVCKKEDKAAAIHKLNALDFILCVYDYDETAQTLTEKNLLQIDALTTQSYDLIREGLALGHNLIQLKTLYDVYGIDIEHLQQESLFYRKGDVVTIEGWAPEKASATLQDKLLKSVKDIEVVVRQVETGDEPPALLTNAAIVQPFESVTKGYSPPKYGELDPTPAMSIFFFVFFGIMLADAGYGLMMAVVGFLIGKFVKFETPTKRMITMFAICGLSGIVFGILFESVFGIQNLFGEYGPLPEMWFNPLEQPMTMLIFSIALGAVHLLVGYTLKTVTTLKNNLVPGLSPKERTKRIFDAIFYSLFMYTLFGAVLMFALPMALTNPSFPFSTVAIVLLVVTLVGILLTAGRNAGSIGGRIAGGFGGLYRLINVFSDVLSYARLFGLALASGAIAMAFNEIGILVFGVPILGYLLGAIALAVLHIFNFLLAALAAYVHNIRLAYVEFYGKFYEGGGRYFAPLGENTKYVRFVAAVE